MDFGILRVDNDFYRGWLLRTLCNSDPEEEKRSVLDTGEDSEAFWLGWKTADETERWGNKSALGLALLLELRKGTNLYLDRP